MKAITILFTATIALMASAQAATIAVLGGAPTVDGADIANLSTTSAGSSIINGDRPMAGQTFTTGTNAAGYQVTAFTVYNIRAIGNSGGQWKIRLGTVSGSTFTEIYNDQVTVGNTALTLSGSGNDWIQFTFTTPQTLSANTLYGIEINRGSGGNFLTLNETVNTAYSGGEAYSNSPNFTGDSAINSFNGRDRTFHLDMTAIPEPSVALLSGLGVLLLLRRRKL